MEKKKRRVRKPDWFKVTYDSEVGVVGQMMEDDSLHTVCKEAICPNRGECYKKRTVTFMIMGNQCSRNCKFCNVVQSKIFSAKIATQSAVSIFPHSTSNSSEYTGSQLSL